MLEIPTNLDDWTLERIRGIIKHNIEESEFFDFKAELPRPDDSGGKGRLRHSVCSFANTYGGFLIFGVKDDRTLSFEERLIGIPKNLEFNSIFLDKISNIQPKVPTFPRIPPVMVTNERVIQIVQILPSNIRPHVTWDNREKLEFYIRDGPKSLPMTYEQIKDQFLITENTRRKLGLLLLELSSIFEISDQMSPSPTDGIGYSLASYDVPMISHLIVDTHPLFIKSETISKDLLTLRTNMMTCNNRSVQLRRIAELPTMKRDEQIITHNNAISRLSHEIRVVSERLGNEIRDKYSSLLI